METPTLSAAPPSGGSPFQAILFKEWIKLRFWWALLLLGSTGWAAYLCLRLRHVHQFNDAVSVWHAWIFKSYLFFESYCYVPLGAGVLLGTLQFLPETLQKKVRLSLRLPLGENRVIGCHLRAGLLGLALILAPAAALFTLTASVYFPAEFRANLALTLAPWALAGLAAYLWTAALLLESSWWRRVICLLLGLGALRVFFQAEFYDAAARLLPALTLWCAASVALPLYACHRFRKGL
jgi:hypothetical protein